MNYEVRRAQAWQACKRMYRVSHSMYLTTSNYTCLSSHCRDHSTLMCRKAAEDTSHSLTEPIYVGMRAIVIWGITGFYTNMMSECTQI